MDTVLDSVKLRWPTWDLHGSPWISCEARISMPPGGFGCKDRRGCWWRRAILVAWSSEQWLRCHRLEANEHMLHIRTRHFVAQPGKTLAQALEIVWILNLRRTLNMYQHSQYIYNIYFYNSISNTEHTESWPQMHHITQSALLWGPSNSGHWTYRSCAPQTVRGHKQGEKKNSRALSQPRSIFVFETQTIERTWESLARCLDSVQRKESVSLICHSENGNSYFIYSIYIRQFPCKWVPYHYVWVTRVQADDANSFLHAIW